MNAKPAPAKPAATNRLNIDRDTLEIAGGGALALLAVGGVAGAIVSRRRKRREQEWADAQSMAFEPFETTAMAEPKVHEKQSAMAAAPASAFAWGNRPPAKAEAETMAEKDDRRPGETWVERAYRGPTPNNPSVSLRARLRRAAFFDKRERDVAAGRAEPVDIDAGLPEALVNEQERELA
jgi:resuscitation-promoting factor RpfA